MHLENQNRSETQKPHLLFRPFLDYLLCLGDLAMPTPSSVLAYIALMGHGRSQSFCHWVSCSSCCLFCSLAFRPRGSVKHKLYLCILQLPFLPSSSFLAFSPTQLSLRQHPLVISGFHLASLVAFSTGVSSLVLFLPSPRSPSLLGC